MLYTTDLSFVTIKLTFGLLESFDTKYLRTENEINCPNDPIDIYNNLDTKKCNLIIGWILSSRPLWLEKNIKSWNITYCFWNLRSALCFTAFFLHIYHKSIKATNYRNIALVVKLSAWAQELVKTKWKSLEIETFLAWNNNLS